MKRIALTLLATLTLFFGMAQSTRNLSSFSEVTAQEGIDVFLTKGSSESARIEADGISMDKVLTDVSGGTLKIHLEGDNHRNVDVKVYVTFVDLSALKASSAASIRVEGMVQAKGDFEISCSSAGDIKVAVKADQVEVDASSSGDVDLEVYADDIDIEVSSAGEVNISGEVRNLDGSASSSGDIDGYDLVCQDADLRASSGASIKVTVNGELTARASSGASIRYQGSPKNTNSDSSSGGSVKRS